MKFKSICLLLGIAASGAFGATITNFTTTGSTLNCGLALSCVQNGSSSITIGGITLTYTPVSDPGVILPSIIPLGTIATTGAGSADLTGVLLTLQINNDGASPVTPSVSGLLPVGTGSGLVTTGGSTGLFDFGASNTATLFGSHPGVDLVSGGIDYTYQISSPVFIVSPTDANTSGVTSIQGFVVGTTLDTNGVPEPSSMFLMGGALVGLGTVVRIKRA